MEKSSNNVERLILAGNVAAERGNNAEAEKIFLQVLAREPKHLDAQVNLGFVLLGARREREAYSAIRCGASMHFSRNSSSGVTGAKSERLSYYYRARGKSRWIFGGQYSIEGSPVEKKKLLEKTRTKT
jgi:hypothetical protein